MIHTYPPTPALTQGSAPATDVDSARFGMRLRGWWSAERLALCLILVLSAALNVVGLWREGYGNTYYAAAVRSMLASPRAFFFAAFDAGGWVTVDKPPAGLWVQAIFARVFGFHGFVLLLPQALAGVASVAVLYALVRRPFGRMAALFAALALAVTPISVVVSRNNTMDSQLVLVLLLAVWAVTRAVESGQTRWLLLCAALVGVGFNIKMLQAYLVVPGLWAAYAFGARLRWRSRLAHLTAATAVLLAVSLSWAMAVDLTPAGSRPYVGSSGTNSAISLALGYNGVGRVTSTIASRLGVQSILGVNLDLEVMPGFAPGIGDPGPSRLLTGSIAGQASWLLPLAVAALVVAVPRRRPRTPLDARGVALTVWGGWLLVCVLYFSFARFYHLYYLMMLSPAVAALAAIGLSTGWREYRRGGWCGLVLPVALAATGALQWRILLAYPDWSFLAPIVASASVAGALALVAARLWQRAPAGTASGAAWAAALALLIAPTTWCVLSVRSGAGGAWLPEAGPSSGLAGGIRPGGGTFTGPAAGSAPFPNGRGGSVPGGGPTGSVLRGIGARGGGSGAMTFAGANWNSLDPALVRYLEENQGAARYLVATPTSSYAAVFILVTGKPALALGGYQGWDRIVTPDGLRGLVENGAVRFFYVGSGGFSGGPGGAGGQDATVDLTAWVRTSCQAVPALAWQGMGSAANLGPAARITPLPGSVQPASSTGTSGTVRPGVRTGFAGGMQLYDCAPVSGPAT